MMIRSWFAVVLLIAAMGCGVHENDHSKDAPSVTSQFDHAEAEPPQSSPARLATAENALKKIDEHAFPHLHNLLQVSDTIYSGGEPEGDASFAELARLGVKTVVSVDGARPHVEAAAKYGLRYVHIPVGYDGVSQEAGEAFAQLARTAETPIYVHCHHGKHRGPAGAAVACIASGERDGKQALEILQLAGTSKDYPGLWRDVENYRTPPPNAPLPELVSVAEVDSMTAAMSKIDRSSDRLKLCAAAEWQAPQDHPDVSPAQEALLLKEGFVEAGRNLSDGYDQTFRDWMDEAAAAAGWLEAALRESNHAAANEDFQAVGLTCKKCHEAYRN